MMKKKIAAVTLLISILGGSICTPVYAAEVFDAAFYTATYEDIVAVLGNDPMT